MRNIACITAAILFFGFSADSRAQSAVGSAAVTPTLVTSDSAEHERAIKAPRGPVLILPLGPVGHQHGIRQEASAAQAVAAPVSRDANHPVSREANQVVAIRD